MLILNARYVCTHGGAPVSIRPYDAEDAICRMNELHYIFIDL